jgi:hypothetical protein
MPTFYLNDPDGRPGPGPYAYVTRRLERQTEKAVLMAITHTSETGERTVRYWFPKSRILIDEKKPFGEIDLKAAKKIEIPEWLYDKRQVAV